MIKSRNCEHFQRAEPVRMCCETIHDDLCANKFDARSAGLILCIETGKRCPFAPEQREILQRRAGMIQGPEQKKKPR